jgi:type IV secretory pathway VirB3-like protein
MSRQLKGVTLIELVMVMVITALVMLSFSGYIKQAITTWNYLSYRSDILNDARLELMRMGRTIRGLSSIDSANNNVFGFSSSVNGTAMHLRYRYDSLSQTVFYDESSSAAGPFAPYPFMNNVNIAANGNFFEYFYASNMNSVNMSDASAVSNIINTGLIVKIKPRFNDRGQTMSIDYDVSPRNL